MDENVTDEVAYSFDYFDCPTFHTRVCRSSDIYRLSDTILRCALHKIYMHIYIIIAVLLIKLLY
jgi:hypothetical protein